MSVYCLGRSLGQILQLLVGFSVYCVGITSPWRVSEGVKSYFRCVSEDAVLSVGWGLGMKEKEDKGPLSVGLAILHIHRKGVVNKGQRFK